MTIPLIGASRQRASRARIQHEHFTCCFHHRLLHRLVTPRRRRRPCAGRRDRGGSPSSPRSAETMRCMRSEGRMPPSVRTVVKTSRRRVCITCLPEATQHHAARGGFYGQSVRSGKFVTARIHRWHSGRFVPEQGPATIRRRQAPVALPARTEYGPVPLRQRSGQACRYIGHLMLWRIGERERRPIRLYNPFA